MAEATEIRCEQVLASWVIFGGLVFVAALVDWLGVSGAVSVVVGMVPLVAGRSADSLRSSAASAAPR